MKFTNRNTRKREAVISTASLPDIVFMLLFFFMVATVMREDESVLSLTEPDASELKQLKRRSLIDFIYVGQPLDARKYPDQIQLDDAFATVEDIIPWKEEKRRLAIEVDKGKRITSLKVDRDMEMGIVTDIKQELRKGNFLKLNYAANKEAPSSRD